MSKPILLTEATNEELFQEIRRRAGVVPSIWTVEDVDSLIADDEEIPELTNEQKERVAEEFLDEVGNGLEDVLGSRGNDYLSDRWEDIKEEILGRIGIAMPKA